MAIISYKKNSNYANTVLNRKYLELYDPVITEDTLEDNQRFYIIQPKYDRRPDLLAYDLYGSARLWWVFVHYNRNAIKDPIMDFTSGKKIRIPVTLSLSGNN
jgi:hypothetical protein